MKTTQVTFRFQPMIAREEEPGRLLVGITNDNRISLPHFRITLGTLAESFENGVQSRIAGTLNPDNFTNRCYAQHLIWADARLFGFFTDTATQEVVKKPASWGNPLDFNILARLYELSGRPPVNVRPDKLRELAYQPVQLNQRRLHNVLNYALKRMRGKGYLMKRQPYNPERLLQNIFDSMIGCGLTKSEAKDLFQRLPPIGSHPLPLPAHQLRMAI